MKFALRVERPTLVIAAVATATALITLTTVIYLHGSTQATTRRNGSVTPVTRPLTASSPTMSMDGTVDVTGDWEAVPDVAARTTTELPPISATDAQDPSSYVRSFVTELFTIDYRRVSRADLLSWAQWEDAPLSSASYPQRDWSKVLVVSLTDRSWDDAESTPVVSDGEWLSRRSQQATQSVADVHVAPSQLWEEQIKSGFQPTDRLATARDVSLTVILRNAKGQIRRSAVSLQILLGSSGRRAGFAVAASHAFTERPLA